MLSKSVVGSIKVCAAMPFNRRRFWLYSTNCGFSEHFAKKSKTQLKSSNFSNEIGLSKQMVDVTDRSRKKETSLVRKHSFAIVFFLVTGLGYFLTLTFDPLSAIRLKNTLSLFRVDKKPSSIHEKGPQSPESVLSSEEETNQTLTKIFSEEEQYRAKIKVEFLEVFQTQLLKGLYQAKTQNTDKLSSTLISVFQKIIEKMESDRGSFDSKQLLQRDSILLSTVEHYLMFQISSLQKPRPNIKCMPNKITPKVDRLQELCAQYCLLHGNLNRQLIACKFLALKENSNDSKNSKLLSQKLLDNVKDKILHNLQRETSINQSVDSPGKESERRQSQEKGGNANPTTSVLDSSQLQHLQRVGELKAKKAESLLVFLNRLSKC